MFIIILQCFVDAWVSPAIIILHFFHLLTHDFHLQAGYGGHKAYGKIRRATSFDAPEPKDATQQIHTDGANYLEPKSRHIPTYIEFLPEERTVNYMYDAAGNRCRELEVNSQRAADQKQPKSPNYVQTTVKENIPGSDYAKYVNQKKSSTSSDPDDSEVKGIFAHQKNSADSVIMRSVERIPSALSVKKGQLERQNSKTSCGDTFSSQMVSVPGGGQQGSVYRPLGRKQRLDSTNSVMSFDSVQTEPAYSTFQRTKLYSSSSSKSNYSMSNISEVAMEQLSPATKEQVPLDAAAQQFWAHSSSDCHTLGTRLDGKPMDGRGGSTRAQVHPESNGHLAGYDIVHASLV